MRLKDATDRCVNWANGYESHALHNLATAKITYRTGLSTKSIFHHKGQKCSFWTEVKSTAVQETRPFNKVRIGKPLLARVINYIFNYIEQCIKVIYTSKN